MRSTLLLLLLLLSVRAAGQDNAEARKLYLEGNRKLTMGRTAEAIAKYDAALALEKHEFYYYQKGLALRRAGDEQRAAVCFSEALKLNADFAAAHHGLGNSCAALRRYGEAVSAFERALALHPKLAHARKGLASAQTGLAQALLDSSKFDEALATARAAMKNDEGMYQPHLVAARALLRLDRHDEAIEEAAAALRLSPASAPAVAYEVGLARRAKGDLPGARAAFDEAAASPTLRESAAYQKHEIDSLLNK
ncbi:MAG: tetratricopeptide repeat protein [Ignavibacteriae bacterium]|nr:tetratricopeptide repeat protein [Ignavibacteriota bacterium]